MDRNLALEFVRITEAAAIASARWMGRGDKESADQAAVDAPFTFSPAGVEFHFAPYHVGSYAEGMYYVLVPYSVLKPVLRPGGPLARWAK